MLKIGDIVSIDADNDDWGRVCSQATVLEIVDADLVLVSADSIRANIIVFTNEITLDR